MTSALLNSSRINRVWIVLLIALALLSVLAMRRSMNKAMGMKVETTASGSLAQLKAGDEAKVVLQVTRVVPNANIEGTELEKQTETAYHRSGNVVKIAFDGNTPVVMGKATDVHEGAVVHITAKMASDHVWHAEQIVVLTGYVTVQ